jgi:hypothetical protein
MKKHLVTITLSCSVFISGQVLAHGDHGTISGQSAISIVTKSVKQLTFKDFGFEVGQLDNSWNDISAEHVSVISIEDDFYIVSATNNTTQKKVFFKIANNGQVLDVKHQKDF